MYTPDWYVWYKKYLTTRDYDLNFGTRKLSDGSMQKFLDQNLENDIYKELVIYQYYEERKSKLKQE